MLFSINKISGISNLKKKLVNDTNSALKYTFIFKAVSKLPSLIASILLVRALSEFDYGVYNILYSVIGLIGMIASLGIGNTLQRYIPEYYQKGEFKIAHNLYKTTSFLRLITNVVMLGLTLIFWEKIAPIIKLAEYKHLFMFFTLIIFLHMQQRILETCLTSYFLHKYSKAIGCVFPIIKAIGYELMIIYGKNLWYAITIDLTAYFIVFASLQLLYIKKIPVSKGSMNHFSKNEKKRITKYAVFYNFNDAGVGLLSASFDNFIIVMFANQVAVGAYSFCRNLSYIIESLLPLSYFMEVIRPAFFSAGTSSDHKDFTVFFQNIIKINSLFSIPCFFFLFLYIHDIIAIVYAGKFITYSSVFNVIFFFTVINTFSFPVELIAQLREKAYIFLYSKIFAIYNLIADILLIKLFGIWGAVFATESAILCKNLFIWYSVREDAQFKGMETFFIKSVGYWMLISVCIYYINALFTNNIFELLFGILIFIIAFFIQFKCNYFNNDEKKFFKQFSNNNEKLNFILRTLKMLPD